jgi:[ribosomal protein S18]-alanine N-acetyltransferase
MTRHLRDMRWWDIDHIMEIEVETFADTAWSAAQFWSELAQGNRRYVVVEDGSDVVAYGGVMVVPPTADIQTIAVSPSARRLGLGAMILDHLLSSAHDRGCTEVLLEVRADNEPAIALYEQAQFEAIARRTSYYGPGRDALVMRRRRP